jgi:hypothetical protein
MKRARRDLARHVHNWPVLGLNRNTDFKIERDIHAVPLLRNKIIKTVAQRPVGRFSVFAISQSAAVMIAALSVRTVTRWPCNNQIRPV